jgi:hypothetical protein
MLDMAGGCRRRRMAREEDVIGDVGVEVIGDVACRCSQRSRHKRAEAVWWDCLSRVGGVQLK